jgi:prophage tail gpP-like protein
MDNKIFYEINGIKYEGVTSFQATDSMVDFGKSFSISVTINSEITPSLLNASTQDEIKIYIDNNLILTGYIIGRNIDYDSSSHTITFEGADRATDLIDSDVIQKSYNIRSFPKLVSQTLLDNGYNLKVINNVIGLPLLDQNEKVNTESGETIINFLFRYAQKVQALLTTNEDGNIVITREDKIGNIGNIVSEQNGGNNNILSASYRESTKDRFNIVEVFSQDTNDFHTEQASNQQGKSIDRDIRSPRRRRIVFSNPTTSKFLNDYAKWFINVKRAKGKTYNTRLQGYYGASLWKSNNLVKVKDDFAGLNGEFLIQDVTYSKSLNGSFTDLVIIEKGSLALEPSLSDAIGISSLL